MSRATKNKSGWNYGSTPAEELTKQNIKNLIGHYSMKGLSTYCFNAKSRNEIAEVLLSQINQLYIPRSQVEGLLVEEKPNIEVSLSDEWCTVCETVVNGIDERLPCRCDIRNQLKAELKKALKETE